MGSATEMANLDHNSDGIKSVVFFLMMLDITYLPFFIGMMSARWYEIFKIF